MGMQSAQVAQPMNQPSGKGGVQMPRNGGMPAFREPELGPPQDTNSQIGTPLISQKLRDFSQDQPMGKGGTVTTPGQGGQPRYGQPNTYSNTVGSWDNASIQPRQIQSGKGKGY